MKNPTIFGAMGGRLLGGGDGSGSEMVVGTDNYTGSSKVIKRLCENVNQIIEDGGSGSDVKVEQVRSSGELIARITVDGETVNLYASPEPWFIDSEGYISINYDNMERQTAQGSGE